MLYFRQDDWQALCSPLIERLTAGTFMKISEVCHLMFTFPFPDNITQSEAHEVLRQRKLGFSFVRLLPKETGVRPIVNLRRRKPAQTVSLNLHIVFNIAHEHLSGGLRVKPVDKRYPQSRLQYFDL